MCELLGAYVGEQSLHLGIRRGIALVEIAQRRSELAVGSAELAHNDLCKLGIRRFYINGVL